MVVAEVELAHKGVEAGIVGHAAGQKVRPQVERQDRQRQQRGRDAAPEPVGAQRDLADQRAPRALRRPKPWVVGGDRREARVGLAHPERRRQRVKLVLAFGFFMCVFVFVSFCLVVCSCGLGESVDAGSNKCDVQTRTTKLTTTSHRHSHYSHLRCSICSIGSCSSSSGAGPVNELFDASSSCCCCFERRYGGVWARAKRQGVRFFKTPHLCSAPTHNTQHKHKRAQNTPAGAGTPG